LLAAATITLHGTDNITLINTYMQFKEPSGITVDKYRGFVGRGKAGAVAGVTDGISQQCGWADGRMGGLSKYGTSSKIWHFLITRGKNFGDAFFDVF